MVLIYCGTNLLQLQTSDKGFLKVIFLSPYRQIGLIFNNKQLHFALILCVKNS